MAESARDFPFRVFFPTPVWDPRSGVRSAQGSAVRCAGQNLLTLTHLAGRRRLGRDEVRGREGGGGRGH